MQCISKNNLTIVSHVFCDFNVIFFGDIFRGFQGLAIVKGRVLGTVVQKYYPNYVSVEIGDHVFRAAPL